jgi:hypothetical protein
MSTTTIHHGPSSTIPLTSSSAGLIFLHNFLPILDSLDPADTSQLKDFVLPEAQFIINGSPIGTGEQVVPMLAMRAQKLARFGHEVDVAWDIPHSNGRRTVMYESSSVTVFKDDGTGDEIRVREFNIIELEMVEGDGQGSTWKAVELRTFMDAGAVRERAGRIMK